MHNFESNFKPAHLTGRGMFSVNNDKNRKGNDHSNETQLKG